MILDFFLVVQFHEFIFSRPHFTLCVKNVSRETDLTNTHLPWLRKDWYPTILSEIMLFQMEFAKLATRFKPHTHNGRLYESMIHHFNLITDILNTPCFIRLSGNPLAPFYVGRRSQDS